MNQPAAYTPLESLFLFQSLLTHGVDNGAFTRISELLTNNTLIKEGSTYDPSRLKPDALQHLFLLLLRDELKSEYERVDGADGANGSPSKKRKLETPPLPTLKDVYENVEKIPVLVDRLYARYSDNVVNQIREDEKRFTKVQSEIQLLERTEKERRARAASQNGTLAIAPRESKSARASNGPTPTPLPNAAVTPARKLPISHTPVIPPKPPTPHAASPTIAPPSHLPSGTTPIRPSPAAKPPNGTGSVLQAPAGVSQSGPRPLQAPAQPPKQAITPRTEVGIKPKDTPATPQTTTSVAAPLKWEKPYQPPHPATPTPRQFQSPAQQGQATPSGPQQQQQHTPQQQTWHPQPTPQYPPQTPGQQNYPRPQQQPQQQHVQHPQPPRPQQPPQPQSVQQPQRQPQQHPQKPPQLPSQPPPQQPPPQPQQIPQQHPQPPKPPPQAQRPPQPLPPKQPQPPQPPQPPRTTPVKPVIVPPQTSGQLAPPLQPAPPRPAGDAPAIQAPQARPPSTTLVPPPSRPIQPPAQHVSRPIASASPAPPVAAAGPAAPTPTQQRWPQAHPQPQAAPKPASPAPAASQKDKSYNSPYVAQPPRPAIPERVIRQAVINTPTKRLGTPSTPHTPVSAAPLHLLHGFGTRWASQSTPSTPKPLSVEPESPAYEPVSPPQQAATLASSAASTPRPPTKKQTPKPVLKTEPNASKSGRGRTARTNPKARGVSATPSLPRTRRSQSIMSHTDEPMTESSEPAPKIKDEEATPRPAEETGDTTADESVPSRPQIVTPGSVSSRLQKRKRQDSPSEPPLPATQVLWTRGFTKVSSSALDQISSHRDANMFATALREKDAPNYRQIVLQPQDITSIRSAIKHGNKAAVQAAGSLPGGDPGTAHVWLPMSEELVPPKGIINSAQLERELVHMFCNAIMYNPDPDRGPGPTFLKRSQDEEEENVGYRVDENGIVKNTRSMFVEVEKLLGDLRSAEKERSAPPPSATRPASVTTPAEDTAAEEDEEAAGERDASTGTGKRRRVGRG